MQFYLLLLDLLCFLTSITILAANTHSPLQPSSCLDHERSALLLFKQSFLLDCNAAYHYPCCSGSPKVKSWAGGDPNDDCCSWDGVNCGGETGHVIGLDLTGSCLYGTFPPNSTLFTLTHLEKLSLAGNNFLFSPIPSEIGQLRKLKSLDLSFSHFSGQIPLEISQLSDLSVLRLYSPSNGRPLKLHDPSLERLVQNLTRLKELSLAQVDISSPVPSILTNITSLEHISLPFCNLYGELPKGLFHLPHLESLNLGANMDLTGVLPDFQDNMLLSDLALGGTSLSEEVPPSIGKLAHLRLLNLQDSGFSGSIPASLGNLTALAFLDLSNNGFIGDIPSSFTNLTQLQGLGLSNLNVKQEHLFPWLLKLNKLTELILSDMDLAGEIPSFLSNFTSLTNLDLSGNKLTGHIPDSLMSLTQLSFLYLTGNQLSGPIPQLISQLTNLVELTLSDNNNLHGNFDAFLKLENLLDLRLSGVKLTFPNKNTTLRSFAKFLNLDLTSCHLTEFPEFLQNQNELQILQLSNNEIHGLIPQWFVNTTRESLLTLRLSNNSLAGFELPPEVLPWNNLEMLKLDGNQLQGPFPIPSNSLLTYDLSNNLLDGGISEKICNASSLNYLDISNNSLSGTIPHCIASLGKSLFVLNLRANSFHASIPGPYPKTCSLKMINLAENQLEGNLPRSLANCTMLEVIDIGKNHITDTFPSWLGNLPKLQVLVLRHNNFHGQIRSAKARHDFRSLRIIDLSNNFLTSDLPSQYLQNWHAMVTTGEGQSTATGTKITFHISYANGETWVHVPYKYSITITNKGSEMLYSKILMVFRVVDFSSNNFTGRIPDCFGELRGLQALNLSNNNLEGRIPTSLANIRDIESLDLSNNMLSGVIPQDLAQLTFLEVFNVSYNHLVGPIPQGRQFDTFDNSSFQGNLGLCGSPLTTMCTNGDAPPPPPPSLVTSDEEQEDSEWIDWVIRSLGTVSGFIVGFVIGKLYITDRNHEWFMETFGRSKRPKKRTRKAPRRSG